MKKPNVFIRGIYSTALTKLFIDAGYPIIFPSEKIQQRFNLPNRSGDDYSKDITIQDRYDKQGLSVMIKKNVWEDLVASNFQDFPLSQLNNPDLIVHEARFHKNAIYRGLVIKSNKDRNFSYIRLTPEEIDSSGLEEENPFQTTLGRYARFMPEGKEGIFQVTHEDYGKTRASLGSFYTIPGDLIVIVPYNNKVIISKEITNGKQKKRLFDLGKEIQQTKKYGYIFRTAAELATNEAILEEVELLEKDLIQTQTIITQFPDRIGEIYSNYRSINIICSAQIKNYFDKIRKDVYPTLENHHIYKSELEEKRYSSTESLNHSKFQKKPEETGTNLLQFEQLLDYTEDLLKLIPVENYKAVNKFFLQKYFDSAILPRQLFNINHQKLNGHRLMLTPGYVQTFEKDIDHPICITLKRRFREGGIYDGLGTPIENGDYALSEFKEGSWSYVTSYYNHNNEFKGRYYNVNTPIQITKGNIRYIDLEVDVVENMVGGKKMIDQDLLNKALSLKLISQDIYDKALSIAKNILEQK